VTSPVHMEHGFAHVRVHILKTADRTVRDSTKRAWNVRLLNAQVVHVPFWFLFLFFVSRSGAAILINYFVNISMQHFRPNKIRILTLKYFVIFCFQIFFIVKNVPKLRTKL